MAHPIDFSQTQRIVLLIDLHPLFNLSDPTQYLTTILSSSKTLLSFPPLSASLAAFRLFFSSLSPLLSSSLLHTSAAAAASTATLSFDHPSRTLSALSDTLTSLSQQPVISPISSGSSSWFSSSPRASVTATSLLQLVHDYAWDRLVPEPELGTGSSDSAVGVRSNLVVLFSPIARSMKCWCEFMDVSSECELENVGVFCARFCGAFGGVNDAFLRRDIHCSWVDVKYGGESKEDEVGIGEPILKLGYFEDAVKHLGWGLFSTESILLGSSLVPFGLIYPNIGVLPNYTKSNNCCKAVHAQLSLEISDVNGKPLVCKCCDLDLICLKMLPRGRYDKTPNASKLINSELSDCEQKSTFWEQFGNGIAKLQVRAVQSYDKYAKVGECLSDVILVRGFLAKFEKEKSEYLGDFFAAEVLEMLSTERSKSLQRKVIPIWPILLSFLHRDGYWASVSLSSGNGNSCMGILKPFTVHSALLSIVDNEFSPCSTTDCSDNQNLIQFVKKKNGVCSPNLDMEPSNEIFSSQSGSSSPKTYLILGGGKGKKNKKRSHVHKELARTSFRNAALEHPKMVLEEVYFARECNKSKKLKFLKCWMKQVRKSSSFCMTMPDGSQPNQDTPEEEGSYGLHHENELPICSSYSAGEDSLNGTSRIQEGAAVLSWQETSEDFFNNLPQKIQEGIESKGVDLGALAERIVNSSIQLLYQKMEMDTRSQSQNPVKESDDTCGKLAAEVTKVLLMETNDLAAKHKCKDPSFEASDQRSRTLESETIVREHELQILFRMEILRSEVAVSINESTRQKFIKQICLFLETIQCHLEGGFFGDASLDDYVGRTIKSRYSHTLEDVVHKIYQKMDLLLFDNDNESPNPLLNSEDNNQSWSDKLERDKTGENERVNESNSAEDESSQPPETIYGSSQVIKTEEHDRMLTIARENRERARRFASFTSWVPDLQRVWAPKQPKTMKGKLDPFQKQSLKRKNCRRANYDMVCETPMTGKKHSGLRGNSAAFEKQENSWNNSSASVSKALFQDDP